LSKKYVVNNKITLSTYYRSANTPASNSFQAFIRWSFKDFSTCQLQSLGKYFYLALGWAWSIFHTW